MSLNTLCFIFVYRVIEVSGNINVLSVLGMKSGKKVLVFVVLPLAVIIIAAAVYLLMSNKKGADAGPQSGINNPYGLNGKVYFFAKQGSTTVIFPNDPRIKEIKGDVVFVNPASSDSFALSLNIPDGKKSAVIESPKIVKGKWRIRFTWSSENKKYFSIHNIEVK